MSQTLAFEISDPTWHLLWMDSVWGMMPHQPDLNSQMKSNWETSSYTGLQYAAVYNNQVIYRSKV